jgi:hypothetical protein
MATLRQRIELWHKRRNPVVEVGASTVLMNGHQLFPSATLQDFECALGPFSRKWRPPNFENRAFTPNTLYTWDDSGIVAYEPVGSGTISSFSAWLCKSAYAFSPKTRFTGKLTVAGAAIDRASTLSCVEAVPHLRRTDDNQYSHNCSATFLTGHAGPSIDFDFERGIASFAVTFCPKEAHEA